ncbi:MAG: hypothetical protein NVS3B20_02960 [Polyangiales bacterium]
MRLPRTADLSISVESRGAQIFVKPLGLSASAVEWAEHVAVYPDVGDHTHAFRRVSNEGVEDLYEVTVPRDVLSFSFDVSLNGVAGVRVIDGSVELLDETGNPSLRAPNPIVFDALGNHRAGMMSVTGCAYDTNPTGPWGRKVTAPGASHCTVTAQVDGKGLTYPVLVDPAWTATFNTKQSHAYHRMVAIPAGVDAGKVLILGGTGSLPAQTELYNPATDAWANSSTLINSTAAFGQGCNAAVLPDGAVVLTGGYPPASSFGTAAATVIVRDATAGAWSGGAAMSSGRAWHTMNVVTVSGKPVVLVTGGELNSSSSGGASKTAEYYDAVVDAWKSAGSMSITRTKHTSAVMSDGRVLVAGGGATSGFSSTPTNSADVWSPTVAGFGSAGNMSLARMNAAAAAVGKGAIIAGGMSASFKSATSDTDSIEYYDGTTWTLLAVKMGNTRANFIAEKLDDGRVLLAGGTAYNASTFTTVVNDSADLFTPGADPKSGTIVGASTMSTPRAFFAAARLPGVGVMVTGGQTSSSIGSETTLSEIFKTTIGGACPTGGCTGGLTCVDSVCCTTSSCATGQKCNNPGHEGLCTKPKGSTCSSSLECASGYCVTGYCCESSCSGGCKTCNDPTKPGVCVLAAAGTDPAGSCLTSFTDATCAHKCDGFGKCGTAYAPAGTPCGSSLGDAGGPFCNVMACGSSGNCQSAMNKCGLNCTTTVTCDEAKKTCTPVASGITSGHCVIDNACWSYGDINPKNKCQTCDPPTSKLTWSVAVECMDGGVPSDADAAPGDETSDAPSSDSDDASDDADGSVGDTSTGADASDDAADATIDGAVGPTELPSGKACSCTTPGSGTSSTSVESFGAVALAGLAFASIKSRRRGSSRK